MQPAKSAFPVQWRSVNGGLIARLSASRWRRSRFTGKVLKVKKPPQVAGWRFCAAKYYPILYFQQDGAAIEPHKEPPRRVARENRPQHCPADSHISPESERRDPLIPRTINDLRRPQAGREGKGSLTLCPARRMAHNAATPRSKPLY